MARGSADRKSTKLLQSSKVEAAITRRLVELTARGDLIWERSDEDLYTAKALQRQLSFRFRYYEATNAPGADPLAIELCIPLGSMIFFAGTQGYADMLDLLHYARKEWKNPHRLDGALDFLNKVKKEFGYKRRRDIGKRKPVK